MHRAFSVAWTHEWGVFGCPKVAFSVTMLAVAVGSRLKLLSGQSAMQNQKCWD